jgi:hypothetical protein
MTHSAPNCPSCHGSVRVLDRYCDYSTTRGPMTAYDITVCDDCKQLHLNRRAAQSTRV